MTVQDWCGFNRVSTYQSYYWRRKIAAADIAKTEPPAASTAQTHSWLAVGPVDNEPTPPGGLTVRIAGAAIELQPDFNPTLLRAVVRALATGLC